MDILYEPSDDSFLVEKQVKRFSRGDVLDMCTGSGIQAAAAAGSKRVKSVTAVDVQKDVVTEAQRLQKEKNITFLHSDLFSSLQGKTFDTIICNPPYLPDDPSAADPALDGGKRGYEFLLRFFDHVRDHLRPNGIILVVFSSLTKKAKIDEYLKQNLFSFTCLDSTHISFETLYAYKIENTSLYRDFFDAGLRKVSFLAKGKRGMVYRATLKRTLVAVKTEHPESTAINRISHESEMLTLLNKKKIGPRLVLKQKEFFAMELVEGVLFKDWLADTGIRTVKTGLKNIFEQLFVLDQLGISKEEMHRPYKHIIFGKHGPVLLDFERAHYSQKPQNVTQFCQCITSSYFDGKLNGKNLNIDKSTIISLSRQYRQHPDKKRFAAILSAL